MNKKYGNFSWQLSWQLLWQLSRQLLATNTRQVFEFKNDNEIFFRQLFKKLQKLPYPPFRGRQLATF